MKSIDNYWYSINPIAILLLPVSLIFRVLVSARRIMYRAGLFKSYKVDKPVIVVGNISVGGTGKTPLIIELVQLLSEWGYKTGIISRGYGGNGPWPHQLTSVSDAKDSGDEPVQIFKRTGVPVVVGPDRVEDAQYLVENNDLDLILADDGLQHYRLQRNVELVVIDQQRKFGNGLMMPAGPLREPLSRLRQKTVRSWNIYNGGNSRYSFNIIPSKVKQLTSGREETLEYFKRNFVHAVAGIGHPQRFFQMLKSAGLNVIEHEFPDHHKFTERDVNFNDTLPVLMTEKDSVKCESFSNNKLWYVAIDVRLSEPFIKEFKQTVNELLHG